jgi:hypothetical protein
MLLKSLGASLAWARTRYSIKQALCGQKGDVDRRWLCAVRDGEVGKSGDFL